MRDKASPIEKPSSDSWTLFRRIRALDFSIIPAKWQLGSPEKALLLVMTSYANPDGTSIRPSLATLARDLACNRDSVIRRRRRLASAKLVLSEMKRHTGRTSAHYHIGFEAVEELEAEMTRRAIIDAEANRLKNTPVKNAPVSEATGVKTPLLEKATGVFLPSNRLKNAPETYQGPTKREEDLPADGPTSARALVERPRHAFAVDADAYAFFDVTGTDEGEL